jgi:hypothetical protein
MRVLIAVPLILLASISARLHGWAQIVAIALLVGAFAWFVLRRQWIPQCRDGVVVGLGLALVIALATAVYVGLSLSAPTLPGSALFLCFVLWLWSALVFGLLLATSTLRKVVLAGLGLTLVTGLFLAGLVPRDVASWFRWRPLLSIVLFAGLIGAAMLFSPGQPGQDPARWLRELPLRDMGVTLALSAAALAGISLGLAATLHSKLKVAGAVFNTRPASATPLPARNYRGFSDRVLLSAFMPAPVLAPGEGSVGPHDVHPVSASDYFEAARLMRVRDDGAPEPAPLKEIPSRCETGGSPCFVLSCPACEVPGLDPTFPFYGLVFRRGEPSGADLTWNAARWAQMSELEIVLQYWVFYADDHWSTRVLGIADLVQEHEADWESVTIGLSADRPLFVATSAHKGGIWQPWATLASVTTDYMPQQNEARNPPPPFDLHPVVAVAIGSHAFYPIGYRGRAPDWATTRRGILPVRVMDWVSEAANITETLNTEVQLGPTLFPENETKTVMSFPGYWSFGDRYEVEMPYHDFTVDPGDQPHGPRTPTLQPLGADPVDAIFADRRWIKYAG